MCIWKRKQYKTGSCQTLEKFKSVLVNKGFTEAVLMDLSMALECLNHELLIAKLHTYGFNRTALKYIQSYLTERQQRVKLNGSFSILKSTTVKLNEKKMKRK